MNRKSFDEIISKIKETTFKENFDVVVGIARGGVLPGFLLSKYLDKPLEIIHLNLRDDNNEVVREISLLLKEINFEYKGKKILLVDDVSRTGKTFEEAKKLLNGASLIKTFVVNGESDYHLYNEECFIFPWLFK